MGIRKVSTEEFKTAFNNAQEWLLNRVFVGYYSDFSKLKDHWVNMSNDEIRAEVNKICPGALNDIQYI